MVSGKLLYVMVLSMHEGKEADGVKGNLSKIENPRSIFYFSAKKYIIKSMANWYFLRGK